MTLESQGQDNRSVKGASGQADIFTSIRNVMSREDAGNSVTDEKVTSKVNLAPPREDKHHNKLKGVSKLKKLKTEHKQMKK